jgi:hypothetical protein
VNVLVHVLVQLRDGLGIGSISAGDREEVPETEVVTDDKA